MSLKLGMSQWQLVTGEVLAFGQYVVTSTPWRVSSVVEHSTRVRKVAGSIPVLALAFFLRSLNAYNGGKYGAQIGTKNN